MNYPNSSISNNLNIFLPNKFMNSPGCLKDDNQSNSFLISLINNE